MKGRKLRTLLVGFGRIARGYANDPVMAQQLKYASHVQVLADHPDFSLEAVVDPSTEARDSAQRQWNICHIASSIDQLAIADKIEVAVVCTPPDERSAILEALPGLKALLVEKPLGLDLRSARKFYLSCRNKGLPVQVNLLRRADERTRELAQGRLAREIGKPQAVFGIYGNGLMNNGTHMVDLLRLLCGEVVQARAICPVEPYAEGPLKSDINVPCALTLKDGCLAVLQPVRFSNYRENGLDIWGDSGRLQYMHGGATLLKNPLVPNRMISDAREIAVDALISIPSTLGQALYHMYSNLVEKLEGKSDLFSPLESALQTATIIDAILSSVAGDGVPVSIAPVISAGSDGENLLAAGKERKQTMTDPSP